MNVAAPLAQRRPSRHIPRMRLFLPAAFLALVATGALTFAPVRDAFAHVEAGDDPAALADLALTKTFTQPRFERELDAALAAEDDDLAASLIELARERGLAVDETRRARLAALQANDVGRAVQRFSDGFLHGGGDSDAAFSGALAADVSGFGDLRDLAREGRKIAAGEEADALTLGLAVAGLALTASLVATIGASMPARGGVTMLKTAHRAGQLSRPLAANLTRSAALALDRDALMTSLRAASRLEWNAARGAASQALRPAAMAELRALGGQASSIARNAGGRGLKQVLATAENAGEIRQAARLAASKGTKTRAVLKVLGRGALMVASLSLTMASWLIAALFYLFALAMFARRLGLSIGRLLFGRPSRKRQERRAFLQTDEESRNDPAKLSQASVTG